MNIQLPFGRPDAQTQAFEKDRYHDRRQALFLLTCLTFWTVFTSAGTFSQMLLRGGITLPKLLTVAGLAVVLFLCIRKLYAYGVKIMPNLDRVKREQILPIYASGVVMVAAISGGTSIPFVAYEAAKHAELVSIVQEVNEDANEVINTKAFSAGTFFESHVNRLEALREGEVTTGLFSGTKRGGEGIHTEILDSLIVASMDAQNVVTAAHGRGKPLADSIKQNQELIRKALEDDKLSYDDRVKVVEDALAAIINATQEFKNLFPMNSVASTLNLYAQDFKNLGLTPLAAARLEGMLHPSAQNLKSDLLVLEASAMKKLPKVGEATPYITIFRNLDAVWVMVLIAVAPDVISLMLLVMIYLTDRSEEDPPELAAMGVQSNEAAPLSAVLQGPSSPIVKPFRAPSDHNSSAS